MNIPLFCHQIYPQQLIYFIIKNSLTTNFVDTTRLFPRQNAATNFFVLYTYWLIFHSLFRPVSPIKTLSLKHYVDIVTRWATSKQTFLQNPAKERCHLNPCLRSGSKVSSVTRRDLRRRLNISVISTSPGNKNGEFSRNVVMLVIRSYWNKFHNYDCRMNSYLWLFLLSAFIFFTHIGERAWLPIDLFSILNFAGPSCSKGG